MDHEIALAILGFADLQKQDMLLGSIGRMDAQSRAKAYAAIAAPKANIPSGVNATYRDEALRRIDGLPAHVVQGLYEKKLALGDGCWYTNKAASAVTTLNIFGGSDAITAGKGNISAEKLEKDYWTLPVIIQVLAGVNSDILDAPYDVIPFAIANGTFEWRANDKPFMPKDTSARIFANANVSNAPMGSHRISNPKWLEPQTRMSFDFKFSRASVTSTNVGLTLYGAVVQPY